MPANPTPSLTIDGRQLSYPGTGLAVVTAEILRALGRLGHADSIKVFVEERFEAKHYNLDVSFIFETVKYKDKSPDYLGRMSWARALTPRLKDSKAKHFIPYFYNYGKLTENYVLAPDLVWKVVPDYGVRDPRRAFWDFRGSLPIRPIVRALEEKLVSRAKHLIVYSEYVSNQVIEYLHYPKDRISMIPLATPSWILENHHPSFDNQVKDKYKLPDNIIMYVGGYHQRKNIPMLLRAIADAYKQDSSLQVAMVGLTDATIASNFAIEEAIKETNVDNALIRLPRLDYPELASLYRLSKFAVYPSLCEGFGLPILEAAAAERLCLCGDNSSMREIQTPEYRIKADDQSAWTKQILYYWQSPEVALQAGFNSRQLCERFSWDLTAQSIWQTIMS